MCIASVIFQLQECQYHPQGMDQTKIVRGKKGPQQKIVDATHEKGYQQGQLTAQGNTTIKAVDESKKSSSRSPARNDGGLHADGITAITFRGVELPPNPSRLGAPVPPKERVAVCPLPTLPSPLPKPRQLCATQNRLHTQSWPIPKSVPPLGGVVATTRKCHARPAHLPKQSCRHVRCYHIRHPPTTLSPRTRGLRLRTC